MKTTVLAIVATLFLVSCSTAPTSNQPAAPVLAGLTPQQVSQQICPALQVTIPAMQAIVGLPQGAYDDLAKAQSTTTTLCNAAKVLTAADAASLEQLAFQTVLPLVEASNPKLAAELEIAQIAVGFVNAIQAGAQSGAAAPVVPSK